MIESRINNPREISGRMVEAIFASGHTPTVQFSGASSYSPDILRKLNRLCGVHGDKLEVRFYGHYEGSFDAAILSHLPDVACLSVDCLMQIENEQAITRLRRLGRLSFGVFRFDKPDFLAQLDVTQLTELRLMENAKRNFDLAPLMGAERLIRLYLEGHAKNIETLTKLGALADLTLKGTPKAQNLKFLHDVRGLLSLSLVLGGRSSITEIIHPGLEQLSVIWVRGLADIGPLTRFPRLRALTVDRQAQITSIDLSGPALRKIALMQCKTLAMIKGLDGLDALVEFRVLLTKLDVDALLARQWPASLKVLGLYSTSQKWNAMARAELDRRGYREFVGR